uniref:Putative secreted protein n=1 Tax=Ixodes ricinus TaxID=34613 RepID=A0A6B0TSM0_IXORI
MFLHFSLLTIGTFTSWSTEGSTPPSLRRPQPVTVALRPMRSSDSLSGGRQMGAMWGMNSSGSSTLTRARSFS